MNITNKLGEIRVAVTEDRLVSALKYVADVPVAPVVPLAVSRQHTLHYSPDRLLSPLDEQMNVIGHQAVSIDKETCLLFLSCEKREKFQVVFVVVKDILTIVTPRDDVIQTTLDLQPSLPCHFLRV